MATTYAQMALRQRSILKNVLDIDFASMTTALTTNKGALVLFDFASAFPSMSQAYMFNLLTTLGVPRNALNLIRALYDNNRCTVQTNGAQVDGFKMTAGVRQGCPLSPYIYIFILLMTVIFHDIHEECQTTLSKGSVKEISFTELIYADEIGRAHV